VYVKPSLTGDEPADVLHYAVAHPDFPHQTTADQFFSESQFESYRALGLHVAEGVFGDAAAEAEGGGGRRIAAEYTRELFSAVVRRWFSEPPQYEPSFVASTRGFVEVQEALCRNPLLRGLTRDLYPELFPRSQQHLAEDPAAESARHGAEVHAVAQMLQVMENAWLSLKLDVNYAHPLNHGWMDVFHRWTNAPTVRRLWPLLRSEFSRDFVRFAERQMQLGVVRAHLEELVVTPDKSEELNRLVTELEDQWPRLTITAENLAPRVFLARVANRQCLVALAALVYPDNPYPPEEQLPPEEQSRRRQAQVPCGVLTVTSDQENHAHELFIWLRGAYRNSGLGRSAVELALTELSGRWHEKPQQLLVRLPLRHLTGPGGELQKRMWLTFYYHLGFAHIGQDKDGHALLRRSVGGIL
jgi:hypothetical protein